MTSINFIKRFICFFCFFALIMQSFCFFASALDEFDESKLGCVSLTMLDFKDGKTAIGGGTITLYRIGNIAYINNVPQYVFSDEFSQSGVSLENLSDREKAEQLAAFALNNPKINGTTKQIDENGKAEFKNLSTGIYLLLQNEAPKGYKPIRPFLIAVPVYEDGKYIYSIDASPKTGTTTEEETTTVSSTTNITTTLPGESKTTTPSTIPNNPSQTTKPTLPNTGQLNWPVPVFANAGIVLMMIGFLLKYSKKDEDDEK